MKHPLPSSTFGKVFKQYSLSYLAAEKLKTFYIYDLNVTFFAPLYIGI